MTAQPLHSPTPGVAVPLSWAAAAFVLAFLIQFGVFVSGQARAQAQIHELQETTKPLRDGELVEIRTNVAWIRREMEREQGRAQ